MESSNRLVPLVPVVMMSVTALASALPIQASQPQPLVSQSHQIAVPVLLATAVPAASIELEQLVQYRITKGIESGLKIRGNGKWPITA